MGNCYNYTPIPPAEASCIIAHLFVELALPCSCCKREDGVIVIQGKTYDGSSARNVNTDGTLNRNNAYNGNNGLRPASMDRPTY